MSRKLVSDNEDNPFRAFDEKLFIKTGESSALHLDCEKINADPDLIYFRKLTQISPEAIHLFKTKAFNYNSSRKL